MNEVGQKTLTLLKEIEKMVIEETDGKFKVQFGGFWITSNEKRFRTTQEEVAPIMESLERAGFVAKVEHDAYETKHFYYHEELNEWSYIRVEHLPNEQDKIKALEEQKAKITAQLEELNNKLLGVSE